MKTKLIRFACLLTALLVLVTVADAQTTAFTYLGRLAENGVPANGSNDFTFTLYDDATVGATVGMSNVVNDLAVANGLFTATLDYGASAFDGSARWLEIAVRPGVSVGAYTNLAPRQPINATPYAIYAAGASAAGISGTLPAASLSGTYGSAVNFNNAANAFSGNGAGLTNLNGGNLTGILADARLSANVALRAGGNAFTGNQTIAGNVGIGTVNPGAKLEVAGPAGTSVRVTGPGGFGTTVAFDLATYDAGAGNAPSTRIQATDNNYSGTLDFLTKQPGAATNPMLLRLQLNLDGHVNIDPSSTNDGAIVGQPALAFGDAGSGEGIASKRTGGGNQWGLDFYTGFQNRMTILNNGNVGIGKTNPATKLDVNGVVTASSDVAEAFEVRGEAAGYSLHDRITGETNRWAMFATEGTLGFYSANAGTTLMSVSSNGAVTASSFNGNAGTTLMLGTTDDQPLELKVNNQRGLRLEPGGSNSVNVIGGWMGNSVAPGVAGATVAGGGAGDYFGSAYANRVEADFSTVSGGRQNTIQSNAYSATIGGGGGNTIQIAANRATIGGGENNTIQTGAESATIGGGELNKIQAYTLHATIGGGGGNTIQSNTTRSTIGGGGGNTIQTNGGFSTIGGGFANTIHPNTAAATIPGGQHNSATNYAFAAGRFAKANHTGAFVWADSTGADFASTSPNEVSFRCAGGVRFTSGSGGTNQTVAWVPGSASWSFSSDRNLKEGVKAVDAQSVLEKVSRLPVAQWNYIGYPQQHIGPMAQDFHALFPLNDSETTLNDADLHGVALAAIQGLNQKVEEEVTVLRAENAELKQRLEKLEQLMNRQDGGAR